MIRTEIKEIFRIAKELHRQKKNWHIHMLATKCIYNNKDMNALILENTTENKTYVYYSQKRMLKQGKAIAKLLYKIDSKEDAKSLMNFNNKIKQIIRKAKTYNKKDISWHHHLLLPGCIFNNDKKQWCIIFEDSIGDKVMKIKFRKEPVKEQEILEKLFYSQKVS